MVGAPGAKFAEELLDGGAHLEDVEDTIFGIGGSPGVAPAILLPHWLQNNAPSGKTFPQEEHTIDMMNPP